MDVLYRIWEDGIPMSYSTLWRTLTRDWLRPWFQRGWIFPRDPHFLKKATPVLDLYRGIWQGQPLGPRDVVLCADEMPGIPIFERIHESLPCGPRRKARHEFEYKRHGSLCFIAFLNVATGRAFAEVHERTGIVPFQKTLQGQLQQPEFKNMERIFLIMDNGSSHHPNTSPARLKALDARITAVHMPVHASWLNQAEVFFSIVSRKTLRPCDFRSKAELRNRLYSITSHLNAYAGPMAWTYTPEKLRELLTKLTTKECQYAAELRRLGIDVDGNRWDWDANGPAQDTTEHPAQPRAMEVACAA